MVYRRLARVPKEICPKLRTSSCTRWGRSPIRTTAIPPGLDRNGMLDWLRRHGFRKQQPIGSAGTYLLPGFAAVVLPRR